jgi:dihydroxy-acid dehydratase
MATVRLDIPTLFVSGGPMAAGKTKTGKAADLITIFEGVAAYNAKKINEDDLKDLECSGCPTPGSCSGMFTANSMNCLCEAIGMALPGNGTILAVDPKRQELYKQAGRQIIELVKKDIRPSAIISQKSIDNAFVLDMAMGGSTNTVLHTLALANEAEIEYNLDRINSISAKAPNICKVSPSSSWHIEDVDAAGGISAILKEVSKIPGLLNLDCMTVSGVSLGERIKNAEIKNPDCIHPLDKAYSKTGGLAILRGNLAPADVSSNPPASPPPCSSTPAPASSSTARKKPAMASSAAKSKPVTWSSSATKAPKAGRACRKCSAPPATSWGRAWANPSP